MKGSLDSIKNEIMDKKILIVGFGVEGQSTYRFIRHISKDIVIGISDANADNVNAFLSKKSDYNIIKHLGEDYLSGDFTNYSMILKTPGIPSKKLSHFPNQDIITSQIDLFLKYYGKKIIGITGTKGKSTTASMLYEILIAQEQKAALVGNIGIPAFDIISDGNVYDYYVCELSSHQLENVRYSPHIALILNIFQDHLDYYGTVAKYVAAKMNIFRYQSNSDHLLIGGNVDIANADVKSQVSTIALNENADNITHKNKLGTTDILLSEMTLKGVHNLLNTKFCLEILNILESENTSNTPVISDLDMLKSSVNEFAGLPHRMEYVGEYDGIHFYNDSISTIPEATISAVKAINNTDCVIIGGYDRMIDYTKLCEYLSQKHVANIILLPDSGYRIHDELAKYDTEGLNIFKVYDMDEAVMIALRYTEKGKTCMFSPAAASYIFYRNFIERGNHFKKCITMYASHA